MQIPSFILLTADAATIYGWEGDPFDAMARALAHNHRVDLNSRFIVPRAMREAMDAAAVGDPNVRLVPIEEPLPFRSTMFRNVPVIVADMAEWPPTHGVANTERQAAA